MMYYDISPPITEYLRVWPGDTPPRREILLSLRRGDEITLSTLHSTVHLGAHADAPSHYGLDAPSIETRDLSFYWGACQVIHVATVRGALLTPEDINGPIIAPRILLATGTFPDPETFQEDFAAMTPALVTWMHERGVRLIGVDTPSVDPFSSKDLLAHKTFLKHDMAILEGLVLRDVPEGLYDLCALPLRLVGFDASPVRAVLRPLAAPT